MNVKNLKVCQVASADITIEFLALPFMRSLKQHGVEVWGVCSPGKWVESLSKEGFHMRTFAITRRLFTPLADLNAFLRLYLLFRREKFHIVHTHTLKASLLSQGAAFLAGVPIRVYTSHGLDFAGVESPLKKILFGIAEHIIARIVDIAFFVNKEDMEYAIRTKLYPKNKIMHLPLGVDLKRFDPARFPALFVHEKKKSLGIPENAKVIGIVARLVKEKGYFELFEAFVNILKKFPDTFLVVIGGEDPEKPDSFSPSVISRFDIANHTRFLGERIDMEELYAMMDLFVLPSYRESLSLANLESSAMKNPVIATQIRGCRESVDDGKTGILVPVKDSRALGKAIELILSNEKLAKQFGEAGRKKVQDQYNVETLTQRRFEEYEKLITRKFQKRNPVFL